MQFSNLSALSLSALKALAISNNAIPTGDKRAKQSWIDALELFAACETIIEDAWVAPEMPSHAEQEAISHAATVDMAKEIIERLEELSIEPANETEAEWEARSGEYIGLSEVLGDIQTEIKTRLVVDIDPKADIWTDESPLTQAVELAVETPEPAAAVEKVFNCKPGAISVIAMLLCAIIATIQATIVIGCATGKLLVYTRSIFKRSLSPRFQPQLDIGCA